MQIIRVFVLAIATILGLSACHEDDGVAPEDYVPHLYRFDIIDSYDQDTARPGYGDLALNPYLYDGLFEIFWQVNSLEDYRMTLRVNDRPSITTSLAVHSEVCGQGRWCDQGGSLICEYTSDYYLSCDNSGRLVDIVNLFSQVPDDLYLFLEVCDRDSSYCEYDYYPVRFE
ncbi:hypothetical protein [Cellvibrio japonicus]|uniref:Putative lipoprotein n=1 Tax=Cellvibrio japonicus (strain Ueda107) TaxID=498211 RepID=B3PJK2_CELJU|nr:hypothetical protein [Cellvibrio japonicus]ACE84952.1 putative lipoprotein [Cellvibrio japonicus Ueda107]